MRFGEVDEPESLLGILAIERRIGHETREIVPLSRVNGDDELAAGVVGDREVDEVAAGRDAEAVEGEFGSPPRQARRMCSAGCPVISSGLSSGAVVKPAR